MINKMRIKIKQTNDTINTAAEAVLKDAIQTEQQESFALPASQTWVAALVETILTQNGLN